MTPEEIKLYQIKAYTDAFEMGYQLAKERDNAN